MQKWHHAALPLKKAEEAGKVGTVEKQLSHPVLCLFFLSCMLYQLIYEFLQAVSEVCEGLGQL